MFRCVKEFWPGYFTGMLSNQLYNRLHLSSTKPGWSGRRKNSPASVLSVLIVVDLICPGINPVLSATLGLRGLRKPWGEPNITAGGAT